MLPLRRFSGGSDPWAPGTRSVGTLAEYQGVRPLRFREASFCQVPARGARYPSRPENRMRRGAPLIGKHVHDAAIPCPRQVSVVWAISLGQSQRTPKPRRMLACGESR